MKNRMVVDKDEMYRNGFLFTELMSNSACQPLFSLLADNCLNVEKERLGGSGDGGYLLPVGLVDTVDALFSPGVDACSAFEEEVSIRTGITSYLADWSVDGPPIDHEKFHFLKKFIGPSFQGESIALSDWVGGTAAKESTNLLLQMDIEGSEYGVLAAESAEFLGRFKAMVIEFHGLERIMEPYFYVFFFAIMSKILKEFYIIHIHPNNCCGEATFGQLSIPRVVEFSFLRKSDSDTYAIAGPLELPHYLDRKTFQDRPDIFVPKAWYLKEEK